MNKLLSISVICTAILAITNCTSENQHPTRLASNFIYRQHIKPTTSLIYPAKDPQHIGFYSKEHKPLSPYRVIGVAIVSKYNLIGRKREEATLHQMMKTLAASIGGDALINIDNRPEAMQASVIQFQHILI